MVLPTGGIQVDKGDWRDSVQAWIHGGQKKGTGRRWPFHRAHRVGKSETFRCARTRVGIHRIADREAKESILLLFASKDKGGAVAERRSSSIRYTHNWI